MPVRRGRRSSPPRHVPRALLAAPLLSLLVLLAPELTLAPLLAGEPGAGGPRPIDHVSLPTVPHRPLPVLARLSSFNLMVKSFSLSDFMPIRKVYLEYFGIILMEVRIIVLIKMVMCLLHSKHHTWVLMLLLFNRMEK